MTTTSTHPHARILSTWENVKRALESAARRNNAPGVVEIVVIFDRRGNPVKHTRPRVSQLEPGDNGDARSDLTGALLAIDKT